jgi:hypothetical protein
MDIERAVAEELSGYSSKSYVTAISGFNRIQGTAMYHEAAEYVRDELIGMGIEDAAIEQFKADGKQMFWTCVAPLGWNIRGAELRMADPDGLLLARFHDIPMSLHTFSKGTPKEGVTAELVDVGAGTSKNDYLGKKVKGKIVLASGMGRTVHLQAVVKRGAAGVVTYGLSREIPNHREAADVLDAHGYHGIWPTAENMDRTTFGFSLSMRQGMHLKQMLRDGKKVRLNAKVDAELTTGKLEIVTATIPGTDKRDEEVILVGHLCHPKPGANDNASGSGTMMEVARTVMKLIKTGKIDRPRRSIRFIWLPETTGSSAYLERHEKKRDKFIAGINVDMVGGDQDKLRSTLIMDRTPDSVPSYVNDLGALVMEKAVNNLDKPITRGWGATFRYAARAFSEGTDNSEFNESTISVPTISFGQWPDMYYHTSMDTIDTISEDSLMRIGWICAVTLLTVADADEKKALELASMTCAGGTERIAAAGKTASIEIFGKLGKGASADELAAVADHHKDRINHITTLEQNAVRSVTRLAQSDRLDAFLDRCCADLGDEGRRELEWFTEVTRLVAAEKGLKALPKRKESEPEKESKRLIPRRMFKGRLDYERINDFLGDDAWGWYETVEDKDPDFFRKVYDGLNFMDGKRSLHSIIRAVSAEFGQTDYSMMMKLMRDLERMKYISFR